MKLFGIPGAPLALTLAGMAPFAAGTGVMWAAQADPVLQAQSGLALLAYGAVILSFVGGLRWGAEVAGREAQRATVLGLSGLGSLAAWALVLYGVLGALGWQVFAAAAGAHLLHGVWDTGAQGLPAWMRRLRAIGTFGAAAALLAGGAVYFA